MFIKNGPHQLTPFFLLITHKSLDLIELKSLELNQSPHTVYILFHLLQDLTMNCVFRGIQIIILDTLDTEVFVGGV